MAYEVPKQWSHGEYVTAADMQKYSDSLNYINDRVVSFEEFATMALGEQGAFRFNEASFVHVFRWLIYLGSGTIADGTNSATLPDASSATNFFDLDSLPWMRYGLTYRVYGVTVCLEDWEA